MKVYLDNKTKGQLLISGGVIITVVIILSIAFDNSLLYSAGKGLLFSLGLIFWGIYKIKGNKYSFKCTNCLKISYLPQLKDQKCPFCGGEIEHLEGFFERHPDLKNSN